MRFMIMHKNDPHTEAGQPPSMDIVHKMGAFIGEYTRIGPTGRCEGSSTARASRAARHARAWSSGTGR